MAISPLADTNRTASMVTNPSVPWLEITTAPLVPAANSNTPRETKRLSIVGGSLWSINTVRVSFAACTVTGTFLARLPRGT